MNDAFRQLIPVLTDRRSPKILTMTSQTSLQTYEHYGFFEAIAKIQKPSELIFGPPKSATENAGEFTSMSAWCQLDALFSVPGPDIRRRPDIFFDKDAPISAASALLGVVDGFQALTFVSKHGCRPHQLSSLCRSIGLDENQQ